MTATAIPQGVSARSWNTLLKITMVAIVLVVLLAGAFAFGRSTADGAASTPGHAASAGTSVTTPANDMPPVSLHTGVVHAYVEPDPASCGHTAHTAPC
jgi:hypothetical protein